MTIAIEKNEQIIKEILDVFKIENMSEIDSCIPFIDGVDILIEEELINKHKLSELTPTWIYKDVKGYLFYTLKPNSMEELETYIEEHMFASETLKEAILSNDWATLVRGLIEENISNTIDIDEIEDISILDKISKSSTITNEKIYTNIEERIKNLSETSDMRESLSEIQDYIQGMDKFSEHHSNTDDGVIAFNVKVYGVDSTPVLEDVRKALIAKGYDHEDVYDEDSEITQEYLDRFYNREIEDAWGAFLCMEINGVEFEGATGRGAGYAVFKSDEFKISLSDDYRSFDQEDFDNSSLAISIDTIKDVEKYVNEAYAKVKKGTTIDEIIDHLDSDMMIYLPKKKAELAKKAKHEASRKFKETTIATGKFKMEGESNITHWGGEEKAYIEMDTAYYSTLEPLTHKIIMDNLNDGQFGVQSIDGAYISSIEQEIDVYSVYEDNHEVKKRTYWETIGEDFHISKESFIVEELEAINKELITSHKIYITPIEKDGVKSITVNEKVFGTKIELKINSYAEDGIGYVSIDTDGALGDSFSFTYPLEEGGELDDLTITQDDLENIYITPNNGLGNVESLLVSIKKKYNYELAIDMVNREDIFLKDNIITKGILLTKEDITAKKENKNKKQKSKNKQ